MSDFLVRHRVTITSSAAAVGVALVVWAYFVPDDWGQSVLVNVGTTLLLVAPLFYLQQALEHSVRELRVGLADAVDDLARSRESSPGPERIAAMDDALAPLIHRGPGLRLTNADVEDLVASGDTGRVVALAAMIGHPELTDPDVVVQSVLDSANGNEQYYALLAARSGWNRLGDSAQADILACIRGADQAACYIRDDPYRDAIARDLVYLARQPASR
ncbi:hypothetical protein [Actinomycetospora sp. TBRC 11914]|uniref:hypothetical protein n=1 Tax=Actinomycetospora sp. TBRC 11914 TaxID=2729387 RepID=UPI00145F6AE5|nr:hypothetical protein [Actinomycetospora sp. TBRC 11914]NMO89573.1 hypothetical protein [Actinomycetospora sp. TBRC 11914]